MESTNRGLPQDVFLHSVQVVLLQQVNNVRKLVIHVWMLSFLWVTLVFFYMAPVSTVPEHVPIHPMTDFKKVGLFLQANPKTKVQPVLSKGPGVE